MVEKRGFGLGRQTVEQAIDRQQRLDHQRPLLRGWMHRFRRQCQAFQIGAFQVLAAPAFIDQPPGDGGQQRPRLANGGRVRQGQHP